MLLIIRRMKMHTYENVLDIVDDFSCDDKLELSEIIKKRAIEERRELLKREIAEARSELDSGKIKPQSVSDIMQEIGL
jgi:hypothetical protein